MSLRVFLFPSQAMMRESLAKGKTEVRAATAREVSWKMGEKNPFRELHGKDFLDLINCEDVMVAASGKELALIRTHLTNIPWPISSIEPAYWLGNHAKFIALNFEF